MGAIAVFGKDCSEGCGDRCLEEESMADGRLIEIRFSAMTDRCELRVVRPGCAISVVGSKSEYTVTDRVGRSGAQGRWLQHTSVAPLTYAGVLISERAEVVNLSRHR
jgi:hypothetical protein